MNIPREHSLGPTDSNRSFAEPRPAGVQKVLRAFHPDRRRRWPRLAHPYGAGCNAGKYGPAPREELPAPVEVATIEHGPIVFRRTFSGTLEATAEFMVAPKISGRIERDRRWIWRTR